MEPTTLPLPLAGDTVSLIVWVVVIIVIPFLVDLITNRLASPRLKASLFLVLNAIVGILVGFYGARQAAEVFDWYGAIWTAVLTFFLSNGVFKFGKNADLLGQQGILAKAVPGGLGSAKIVDTSFTVISEVAADEPVPGGTADSVAKGPETRLL